MYVCYESSIDNDLVIHPNTSHKTYEGQVPHDLTFVVETKQVDERAVRRTQRRLFLLRSQWFEMGQVGGASGRDDRRLDAPLR